MGAQGKASNSLLDETAPFEEKGGSTLVGMGAPIPMVDETAAVEERRGSSLIGMGAPGEAATSVLDETAPVAEKGGSSLKR